MRDYQFQGNFLYYVRMIKRLYEATLNEAANQCGMTLPEADVLSFLRENPEFDTSRDVALYREVSRAYVSKAVELLVGRGYLETVQDPNDRRLQHLHITANAKEAADTLHKAQIAFYGKVTQGLSNAEILAMLSAIQKCAQNLTD
ncbi:MAG: MarR family winged helix-turn-helix transcriptional regulator [Oscillospiraceae bacterium]|jgi:MarR family transcriptional regulator for hemolysin|nr:MarR family winged helix-turn-helix transcriptional regulator [Oscillospiraceae bacterium]